MDTRLAAAVSGGVCGSGRRGWCGCGRAVWRRTGVLEKIDAYSREISFFSGSRDTAFLFIQNPFPSEPLAERCRTHPSTRERVSQLWQMARNLRTAT
ncbi:MAG: hypothetical protein HY820_28835 [Acidobacteria bacterium]|nr:hypothetical protein [Acidobacteriota bacterium]